MFVYEYNICILSLCSVNLYLFKCQQELNDKRVFEVLLKCARDGCMEQWFLGKISDSLCFKLF